MIEGLDLDVEAGAFLCVIGPSGCGKSTFLRVAADLLTPLGGSIEVLGGAPAAARARRDVGFVFQDPTLLPWRTVRENVRLPLSVGRARIAGDAPAERLADRADSLLETMGLSAFAERLPHQLSGGQRQRVAIARALQGAPRLLLMDEPFGALDEITRDRLNDELLAIWRKTGATVIFVTHSIAEAVWLGERVIVLAANPGRIVHDLDLRAAKAGISGRDDPALVAAAAELRVALGAVS
ncbi:MAG: ABC transporter ATP-binding protein [Pikeienuella sp.]|uniref:ABC transporter ATP-binding protein n=1 Tax=Pikeienuella sp. TaxID=2831957 RepID=UPI00391B6DCE